MRHLSPGPGNTAGTVTRGDGDRVEEPDSGPGCPVDSWIKSWARSLRLWWRADRQRKNRPLSLVGWRTAWGAFWIVSPRRAIPPPTRDPPARPWIWARPPAARRKPGAGVKCLAGSERSKPVPGLQPGAFGLSPCRCPTHPNLQPTPFSTGICIFKDL